MAPRSFIAFDPAILHSDLDRDTRIRLRAATRLPSQLITWLAALRVGGPQVVSPGSRSRSQVCTGSPAASRSGRTTVHPALCSASHSREHNAQGQLSRRQVVRVHRGPPKIADWAIRALMVVPPAIYAANHAHFGASRPPSTYHPRDGRRRSGPPLGHPPEGRVLVSSLPHHFSGWCRC